MSERDQLVAALGRAGRRAMIHLIQAAIEGVKAVESVIDEIGSIGENEADRDGESRTERIEVE
ncbi:MAG: hypothetical protein DWQ40_10125 [Actinobacteria bacterium]|nr:MAG: hypothetical protein DWQ40_10125 [Actinomycetota bacterium]